jgi:hypothetical protein
MHLLHSAVQRFHVCPLSLQHSQRIGPCRCVQRSVCVSIVLVGEHGDVVPCKHTRLPRDHYQALCSSFDIGRHAKTMARLCNLMSYPPLSKQQFLCKVVHMLLTVTCAVCFRLWHPSPSFLLFIASTLHPINTSRMSGNCCHLRMHERGFCQTRGLGEIRLARHRTPRKVQDFC